MRIVNATTEEILKELHSTSKGLSSEEVEKRRKKYGDNILPSKLKKSNIIIFLSQFKSPLVYVLLLAAVISVLSHALGDAVIIFIVLIINAAVGYYQESKAENTLYKLRQVLPQTALVKRDGDIKQLVASELVPGDVILLKAGEKIVADVKIIKSVDLSINEAFLTGESRPVLKKEYRSKSEENDSVAYAGSIIVYGEGEGVVMSTGSATRLGSIASLVNETKENDTPLQLRIKQLANKLVLVLLVITIGIFFIGIHQGYTTIEMTTIAVALAVSAIPEGLLITITVILVIGMQRILKEKALVKKLLATETLGSTSVICTDKTGTLTEGAMKVTRMVTLDYDSPVAELSLKDMTTLRMFDVAVYCNDAVIENYQLAKEKWNIIGRPTDRSLIQLALDFDIPVDQKRRALPRTTFIPFDSKTKLMTTVNRVDKDASIFFVKGAPEKILSRSIKMLRHGKVHTLTVNARITLLKKATILSSSGYRVLAAAYKTEKKRSMKVSLEDVNGLIFVGFYIIEDPLRPEAKSTIKDAKNAGIETVMITGDHPKTALSIANQLGLNVKLTEVITGEELEKLSDKQLFKVITSIKVFARVVPEDKLRIVKAWQKAGHVVAMTGDGINDAPALKKADIGIAIGSGTEVAKEAADLVLLDDNFKTIVSAVAEGRVIFSNVKKVTLVLLSGSFGELIIIIFALLFGIPLPLLAVQILWINIITDGLPSVALSAEPAEQNILELRPIKRRAPIVDLRGKVMIVLMSIMISSTVIGVFLYYFQGDETLQYARTLAFSLFALGSLAMVYSIRDTQKPFWRRSIFDNYFLLYSVLFGIALQFLVVYTPLLQNLFDTVQLSITDWFVIVTFSGLIMLGAEFIKSMIIKFIPK